MNKWLWLVVFLLPGFDGQAQNIILNELSASVTNSQVDNYGEFEDWIEVYNGSKSDVNLAGWYLSDNPAKPLKWRIPASNLKITTILAGSCLLLWADKDTMQGPDHLGFSLKKKGEYLFLFRPTKDGPVLEDSVRYGALSPDQSFGRCPDRNNEWIVFKHPTPGKPNICVPDKKRKVKRIPLPAPADPLLNGPGISRIHCNIH
ncbi:MAG: lamin tail domain-containing protein [Porphyromonadaceae bacterium]|nr:MAG: lamin tail domain-containing protein [Porphyromonadaceae bacterium]